MRIGVVGLGLIGGSWARAARSAGWTVHGWDPDAQVLSAAQTEGVIESLTSWRDWIALVDAVVLAVPLGHMEKWVDQVAATARTPLTVVELGSVKSPIMPRLKALPDHLTPLSLHPMAGREVRGFANSRADLFRGHPCAVVQVPGRPLPEAMATAMVSMIGARPHRVTADGHDRIVARVSHLPYLVSAALLAAVGAGPADDWRYLVGTGFQDTTRVGASDPHLLSEIIFANRPEVVAALESYLDVLTSWVKDLEAGQWPPGLLTAQAVRKSALAVADGEKERSSS